MSSYRFIRPCEARTRFSKLAIFCEVNFPKLNHSRVAQGGVGSADRRPCSEQSRGLGERDVAARGSHRSALRRGFFAHAGSNGVPLGRNRVESVGLRRVRGPLKSALRTRPASSYAVHDGQKSTLFADSINSCARYLTRASPNYRLLRLRAIPTALRPSRRAYTRETTTKCSAQKITSHTRNDNSAQRKKHCAP